MEDDQDDAEVQRDGGWPANRRTAGKWHSWCADCGAKNHKNSSECSRCGAGSDGQLFMVKYRGNVGKPKYTSDGEEGVYVRD